MDRGLGGECWLDWFDRLEWAYFGGLKGVGGGGIKNPPKRAGVWHLLNNLASHFQRSIINNLRLNQLLEIP